MKYRARLADGREKFKAKILISDIPSLSGVGDSSKKWDSDCPSAPLMILLLNGGDFVVCSLRDGVS